MREQRILPSPQGGTEEAVEHRFLKPDESRLPSGWAQPEKRSREQLKNLWLEDFQEPNRVLCYGAGTVARYAIESYLCAGMNVAGFIDRNKKGTVETSRGALPIHTIDGALAAFGKDVSIIVTIESRTVYEQVREDLIAAGFSAGRIFDHTISSWLTVPSLKCWCRDLFTSVRLAHNSIMKCCMWGENRNFSMEPLERGVPYEQALQNCVDKIEHYYERARAGEVPLYCAGCPFLEDRELDGFPKVQTVVFAVSAHCNLECSYCYFTGMRNGQMEEFPYSAARYGELFQSMLRYLREKDMLAPNVHINYAGGEISIHPGRKALLSMAEEPDYECYMFTNCVVYSEEVAQALSGNARNAVMCDLDAGTRESYMLVKGFDYFDQVVENLRKYARRGKVILKYIVLPGMNTSMEDYLGTVRLLKELKLEELILSRDYMLSLDFQEERRVLFEVARLRNVLAENGIRGIIDGIESITGADSFSERQIQIMDRFFRQTPPKGDTT